MYTQVLRTVLGQERMRRRLSLPSRQHSRQVQNVLPGPEAIDDDQGHHQEVHCCVHKVKAITAISDQSGT